MKAIIDGKRYDTETAKHVAELSNMAHMRGDFGYWEAELYRTPRGNWFLAGHGGPQTSWARAVPGGGWSGSEGIIPIGEDDARQLLEERGLDQVVEEHFGDIIEDA